MHFFEPDKSQSSYKPPLAKILISTIVLILIFFRKRLINVEVKNYLISNLISIIWVVLICFCILTFYISFLELYYAFKCHHPPKIKKAFTPITVSLSDLLQLLDRNDIIEIEVIYNGKVLVVGSSSICDHNSNVFYDKQYYIGSNNYQSLYLFEKVLVEMFEKQACDVITIDGCNPAHYKALRRTD